MNKWFLVFFILIFTLPQTGFSQGIDLKWGVISKEEIALKECAYDKEALDVYLFMKLKIFLMSR